MAISILTFQDEADGSVSIGFTTEPVIESEEQGLSNAMLLGLMSFHNALEELQAVDETDSSKMEE